MAEQPLDGIPTADEPVDEHEEPGGKLIPLRAADAGSAVAFSEGKPDGAAYLDVTGTGGRRQDIIPGRLRRDAIGGTVREGLGKAAYLSAYHGIRSPWHALRLSGMAARGGWRWARQVIWWADAGDLRIQMSQAMTAGRAGHHEAMRAHTEGEKTRSRHWKIVAVCAVLAAVLLGIAASILPLWGWILAAIPAFCVLVWHGRPEDKPIIAPAIMPASFTVPTPEIITRAFGSLGIDKINAYVKEHGTLEWVSDVHRDGEGWGVELDLPYGVTAKKIIEKRPELSSGLRRPLSAVWPESVSDEHDGRLFLWIGRHDMAKVKPPPYPLLKTGTCSVFDPVPFAVTPRRIGVTVPLFESCWLIGATMGNGKTSAIRVLLANAALDVQTDLWTHEFSGKGDLEPFAQVSHRYCSGMDKESIEYAARSAAMLRTELERRQKIFKKLPREAKPDGCLTREMAADRTMRLRPIVAIFDEFQVAIQDPDWGGQIAEDIAFVMRLGRAYGLIIILATQRPDKESVPTSITGVVAVRFCLKVPDQVGNDMILGTGAYKAGFNAVLFRHKIDAGLGWLRGAGEPQAVRTYYLDLPASARIAARARVMRQAAGVLSGHALGEDDDAPARDILADVMSVFGPGEAGAHWQVIADRLAARYPERWTGATAESVSADCRDAGVPSVSVKASGSVLRGCRKADVEAAAVAS